MPDTAEWRKKEGKNVCTRVYDNGKETVVILMRHMTVTLSIIAHIFLSSSIYIPPSYVHTFMNIYFDFSHCHASSKEKICVRVCANWISEKNKVRKKKIFYNRLRMSEIDMKQLDEWVREKKKIFTEWVK